MQKILLSLLFLFFVHPSLAQKEGKAWCDSMLMELPKLKEDTNKVRFIAKLCWELAEYDAPGAIKLTLAGLHLAEKLGDKYGEGLSHIVAGGIYDVSTRGPEATDHYLKAQPILEEIGEKTLLCTDYLFLAHSFYQVDSGMSIAYLHKAKALLPKNTGNQWKARNYGLMGNLYRWMGQYDSAKKYIAISMKMCELHRFNWDKYLMITCMGYLYGDIGKLDSAYILLQSALTYGKKIENTRLPGEILGSLSETRYKQSQLDKSNRSRYLKEAEKYAIESMKYGRMYGSINTIGLSYKSLTDIYYEMGEYKKAMDHSRIGMTYYIMILGPKTIAQLSNLSWKYENKLKEKQMELLKLRNRQQLMLNIASAAGVVILIIIVILIISNRRKLKKAYLLVNQQKEEIEVQKEEVETQKEALEDTLDKLKQTQSQLIQSEKMASLGMLTAGIAHEINNPVNFINSGAISLQKDYEDLQQFIQSIEQQFPGAKKLAEEQGIDELLKIIPQTIEDIKTGVSRTSEIVKGLRNFTRMDASELKEADIHEGIDSTILLLTHKIKDRINIVKDYDEHIGSIKCYPGPLNQVFMNLLNNAIDAIEQKIKENSSGGVPSDKPISNDQYQITISTKMIEEGGNKQVKIVISDNGAGIPDEIRDKLFDPFFTTKEVGKGTGLGLAICHGIIEKHGGSISFESRMNEGSVFTITLQS